MFDIPTLFTLFIPIVIFYLSFHFNLKKEIDELSYNPQPQNKHKIKTAKKILKSVKISTIILILIIVAFQIIPLCKNISFSLNDKIVLPIINIWNSILKFFHINAEMFSSSNFVFSFIVGIILSIIIEFIIALLFRDIFKHYIFSSLTTLIGLANILLQFNNSFSSFLVNHITHYFVFLSFIINIFVYALIGLIAGGIIFIIQVLILKIND